MKKGILFLLFLCVACPGCVGPIHPWPRCYVLDVDMDGRNDLSVVFFGERRVLLSWGEFGAGEGPFLTRYRASFREGGRLDSERWDTNGNGEFDERKYYGEEGRHYD